MRTVGRVILLALSVAIGTAIGVVVAVFGILLYFGVLV